MLFSHHVKWGDVYSHSHQGFTSWYQEHHRPSLEICLSCSNSKWEYSFCQIHIVCRRHPQFLPQNWEVEWPPELRTPTSDPSDPSDPSDKDHDRSKKLCLPRLWKWIPTRTNLQVGNIIQNDQSHISRKWKSTLYTYDYIVSTLANRDTYFIYSSQIWIEIIFASKIATKIHSFHDYPNRSHEAFGPVCDSNSMILVLCPMLHLREKTLWTAERWNFFMADFFSIFFGGSKKKRWCLLPNFSRYFHSSTKY